MEILPKCKRLDTITLKFDEYWDLYTKNVLNSLDYYIFQLVLDKTDERTSPVIKSNKLR